MTNARLPYLFFATLLILVMSPLAAQAACVPGVSHISNPAERLDERVQNLAHQTGCPLETNDAFMKIEATVVPAIDGSMTAIDAYNESLTGTGLHVSPVDDSTGTHFKVVLDVGSPDETRGQIVLYVIALLAVLLAIGAGAKRLLSKKTLV